MAVHEQSVISESIRDYDEDLYNGLTSKENYCYTESYLLGTTATGAVPPFTGTEEQVIERYQPFFSDLNTSITTWLQYPREQRVYSMVSSIYNAIAMIYLWAAGDESILEQAHADNIFNGGGAFDSIITAPENYYDDLVIGSAGVDDEAAKLTEDAELINEDKDSGEQSRIDTSIGEMSGMGFAVGHSLMFSDRKPSGSITKAETATKIFDELGYRNVYTELNVGSLEIPESLQS